MMYNWDVKIQRKERKNDYCKEHKSSLIFTGLYFRLATLDVKYCT